MYIQSKKTVQNGCSLKDVQSLDIMLPVQVYISVAKINYVHFTLCVMQITKVPTSSFVISFLESLISYASVTFATVVVRFICLRFFWHRRRL